MKLLTVALILSYWFSCGGNNPPHKVALRWNPSTPIAIGFPGYGQVCPTPGNACRYNVYRAVGMGGTFVLIASNLVSPVYVDTSVLATYTYQYEVKAVDVPTSVLSAASVPFVTVVP